MLSFWEFLVHIFFNLVCSVFTEHRFLHAVLSRPAIFVEGLQVFKVSPRRREVVVEVAAALFALVREEVDETVQVSLKENDIWQKLKKELTAFANLTMKDFTATSG